jgi:putative phosphonate metabolism protein
MRYAIYFTPEKDDPLGRVAERWLGRSAFASHPLAPAAVGSFSAAEIAFHTAAPRRYGFHATLKAPFRLAEGRSEGELIAALSRFAAEREPVTVERIALARLDGFFALVPALSSPELDRLAGDVVTAFEPFRAPLTSEEIERRNPDGLTPEQLKNLYKWGYPHVFDEFRFHMTLTGRVPAAEAARMEPAIESFFGPLLLEPLEIASLALFAEQENGAPFHIKSFHAIGGERERKSA